MFSSVPALFDDDSDKVSLQNFITSTTKMDKTPSFLRLPLHLWPQKVPFVPHPSSPSFSPAHPFTSPFLHISRSPPSPMECQLIFLMSLGKGGGRGKPICSFGKFFSGRKGWRAGGGRRCCQPFFGPDIRGPSNSRYTAERRQKRCLGCNFLLEERCILFSRLFHSRLSPQVPRDHGSREKDFVAAAAADHWLVATDPRKPFLSTPARSCHDLHLTSRVSFVLL